MRSAGANTNGFLRAIKLALTCAYVVIAAVGVHAGEGPGTLWQGAQQALAARDNTTAKRLFEQLVEEFPGTIESARAQTELRKMRARLGVRPDPDAAIQAGFDIARTERLRREFLMATGDRVFFAENSAGIGGRARAMIENQARWLIHRPDIQIIVIGRSDDGVAGAAALPLSMQRAEAVRERLIAAGVGAERIRIDARGDADKLAVCQTFMCKAQNRNVETLISQTTAARGSRSESRMVAPENTAQTEPSNGAGGVGSP